MKKNCLIGLCTLALCHNATAGVTGFSDNSLCNACIASLACGATYGYEYMQKGTCSITADEVLSQYHDAVKEACQHTNTNPNIIGYIPETLWYGALLYEEFECGNTPISDKYVRVREYAKDFIHFCQAVGACECGGGNYVQPMGIDNFLFGMNSQCNQCPTGGTSDEFDNIYITSCYIASGGAFSDDTGSGILTENCRYFINGDPLDTIQ